MNVCVRVFVNPSVSRFLLHSLANSTLCQIGKMERAIGLRMVVHIILIKLEE